jgi:hypothetical protein
MLWRVCMGAVLLLALWPAGAGAQTCPDEGGVGYVCGVDDPEDLIRAPGTPFVITTGLGHGTDSQRGGLYAVHVRTRLAREVRPDLSGPLDPRYRACPGPPDPAVFSAHGLALAGVRSGPGRRMVGTLYVVNHGGREAVEVFRVEVTAEQVRLAWKGCVVTPNALAPNSVAPLPGGDLVVTIPILTSAELLNAGMGQPTGDVRRWSPATGWRSVPGAAISFPNGLLVAPDGERLFVAGYTEQAVVELPLAGGTAKRVEVPFNPDNLRWSPTGEILVAGQDEEPAVVQFTCVESEQETCPIPTGVAKLDPASFTATALYAHPGDDAFGMGTTAIVVGDELWLGSARAKRLLRVPLQALSATVTADTPSGLPSLRLTRRCSGRRVRVAVRGDVAQVEQVRFRPGGSDRRAPFARTVPRSAAGRTLRAVASVRHGEPAQVALRRGKRRCAGM